MSPFLCWEKVTTIDLQRFIIIHWFFFKEIFPWGKVIHFDTLGLIFWAIGFFLWRFFLGEKLSISTLWAWSFEPLVLFQGDFSLGESYPFWHLGPDLLSHWFFFKEIFPWGKVVHSGTTLGPIFWTIGSFSKRFFLGGKVVHSNTTLAPSFELHWFVK